MTDKVQKIREEVERLKGWNNNVRNSTRHMTLQEEDFNRGKHSSYIEILNFIDSLQEEPVSEDLEKTAVEAFKQIVDSDKNNFLEIFKAGAEWQKQKTVDKACKWIEERAARYLVDRFVDSMRITGIDTSIIEDFRKAMEE